MQKLKWNSLLALSIALLAFSCKKEENNPDPKPQQEIKLPLSGHYVWTFDIPNVGSQESHLVFYTDSIGYVMSGAAYSTNYVMMQDSYTEQGDKKRWIGIGKGGSIPKDKVWFVMFFKDITNNAVTVYKHECQDKAEAESFPYPADDATADHGWNIYYKK